MDSPVPPAQPQSGTSPSSPQSQSLADTPVAGSVPAVAAPVIQAVASPSSSQISVSKGKESGPASNEVTGFVEVAGSDAFEKEPLPPEVSSWMEKVNRGEQPGKLDEIVIADKNVSTQNLATPQPNAVYVLPLGQNEMKQGLGKSVNESVRWLAEWCKYLVKKFGRDAAYQE